MAIAGWALVAQASDQRAWTKASAVGDFPLATSRRGRCCSRRPLGPGWV